MKKKLFTIMIVVSVLMMACSPATEAEDTKISELESRIEELESSTTETTNNIETSNYKLEDFSNESVVLNNKELETIINKFLAAGLPVYYDGEIGVAEADFPEVVALAFSTEKETNGSGNNTANMSLAYYKTQEAFDEKYDGDPQGQIALNPESRMVLDVEIDIDDELFSLYKGIIEEK